MAVGKVKVIGRPLVVNNCTKEYPNVRVGLGFVKGLHGHRNRVQKHGRTSTVMGFYVCTNTGFHICMLSGFFLGLWGAAITPKD